MSQLLLPIFPKDTKMITPVLGVREKDGLVHYLLSGLPIYSHAADDLIKFRYANKTLTVTLHTLSSPRANQAAEKLCEFLNQTETEYPYTDLKLIYKTMAV